MVIGLMNKLEDIAKIYRKLSAVLAPSMEEYGTKLAPYSISCATKNVNLLPDPVWASPLGRHVEKKVKPKKVRKLT